jgi:hypothetical protein
LKLQPPALLLCGSRVASPHRREACRLAGIPVLTSDGSGQMSRNFAAVAMTIGETDKAEQGTPHVALSRLAAFIIQHVMVKTVLVEGGATAAALAEHMNWMRFAVVATAPAGVGVLRPIAAHPPLVLIKPGSYPWPNEIWESFVNVKEA